MERCDECRFFGAPDALDWWDENRMFESEHHTCVRIIHGNSYREESQSAHREKAVVTDGSGYAAKLRVLPDFGCVLWEEKKAD